MAKKKKKNSKKKKGSVFFKAIFWVIAIVLVWFLGAKFFKEKPPTSLNNQWRYVSEWGGAGKGPGQFNQPRQIGIDSKGVVYVMDRDNNRVQKFSNAGKFVAAWGAFGKGKAQFNQPFGLAVDAQRDLVYVVDTWNNAIKQFNTEGKLLHVFQPKGDSFFGPRSIAVGKQGQFYITDTGHHRVMEFDASGNYLRQWGGMGNGKGQFHEPVGISIDREENVYVSDMINHRIEKFDANGTYLAQWSYKKIKGIAPMEPYLSIDGEGKFFISDPEAGLFQVFAEKGKFLGVWGSNLREKLFDGPICVTFGQMGEAYVADAGTQRIYKFQR